MTASYAGFLGGLCGSVACLSSGNQSSLSTSIAAPTPIAPVSTTSP